MEALPIVLISVLLILAIILAVVGVQVVLVLQEARRALKRINQVLDQTEQKWQGVIQPIQNLGGIATGLQTGLKVFDTFVNWLAKNKKQDKDE